MVFTMNGGGGSLISPAKFAEAVGMYAFPIDTLPSVPNYNEFDDPEPAPFDAVHASDVGAFVNVMIGAARVMGPGDGYVLAEDLGTSLLTLSGSQPGQKVVFAQYPELSTSIEWHLDAPEYGMRMMYDVTIPMDMDPSRSALVELSETSMARFLCQAASTLVTEYERGRVIASDRITRAQYNQSLLKCLFSPELGWATVDLGGAWMIPNPPIALETALDLLLPIQSHDHFKRRVALTREVLLGTPVGFFNGSEGWSSDAVIEKQLFTAPESPNGLQTYARSLWTDRMPYLAVAAASDERYCVEFADRFLRGDGAANVPTMSAPFNAFWASAARTALGIGNR